MAYAFIPVAASQAEIFIPALNQRLHFAVSDTPLQHPKTAIRMHIMDAAFTENSFRVFDSTRNLVPFLYDGRFNIDDPDADADSSVHFPKQSKLGGIASRHFQDQMVGMQMI